jgi:hypothetical protein
MPWNRMVRRSGYTGIALTLESEMDIIDMCIKTNFGMYQGRRSARQLTFITALRNRTISLT